MRQSTWRWAAGAFLLFMLCVAIGADGGTLPKWLTGLYHFPGGDWVGHFALYGILAFLGMQAFPQRVKLAGRAIPAALLVTILLAALEELSQFWFPLRTPDWRDLSFGALGATIFTWLALRWQRPVEKTGEK